MTVYVCVCVSVFLLLADHDTDGKASVCRFEHALVHDSSHPCTSPLF